MPVRAIRHVDAFTTVPLEGNPAAVVDGEGLSAETMQQIALNQRLSETVFLLPPQDPANHARLRIFTPGTELPFAGHPTIAAAHIIVTEQRARLTEGEGLRLETDAGVIEVTVGPGQPPLYTMTQTAPRFREATESPDEIASSVGLEAREIVHVEWVHTGLWWLLAQVTTVEAMERMRPDLARLVDKQISLFSIGARAPDADVHVRSFAPGFGIVEDPVTGSSNGCIGALIARRSLLRPHGTSIAYVAEQGVEMGQPGRVYVRVTGLPDDLTVQVGGNAVTVLHGELLLAG